MYIIWHMNGVVIYYYGVHKNIIILADSTTVPPQCVFVKQLRKTLVHSNDNKMGRNQVLFSQSFGKSVYIISLLRYDLDLL